MGVSGRIDQNPRKFTTRIADTVHDLAFVITLQDFQLHPENPGFLLKRFIDLLDGSEVRRDIISSTWNMVIKSNLQSTLSTSE